MDDRPSYRLPVEIDAWLYKENSLFAKASILNVSHEGMFIRTNVMLLPKNSQLNVKLYILVNGQRKNISILVTVIHRCLDGIGVKIEKISNEHNQSIVSLLALISTVSYLEYEANLAA